MHDTALICGKLCADNYAKPGQKVVDIGGLDINGSLRLFFENLGCNFICIDIEKDESVDIVVPPNHKLPFDDESIDIIVSTSCFEHDPVFWMTFREMSRIIKKEGLIYVNAPSNGPYHQHPGDNWRFYRDSGQALAFWANQPIDNKYYSIKIVETFFIHPKTDTWIDFVCLWQKTADDINVTNSIILSDYVKSHVGKMEEGLQKLGFDVRKNNAPINHSGYKRFKYNYDTGYPIKKNKIPLIIKVLDRLSSFFEKLSKIR